MGTKGLPHELHVDGDCMRRQSRGLLFLEIVSRAALSRRGDGKAGGALPLKLSVGDRSSGRPGRPRDLTLVVVDRWWDGSTPLQLSATPRAGAVGSKLFSADHDKTRILGELYR